VGRCSLDIYRKNTNIVYAEFEHATLGGVYRSEDKGVTWARMSDTNPRPSYFSQIRVDPNNDQKVWLGGVNIYMSEDGGRTFVQTRFRDVHSDVHGMWIDPANSDHMINGNDGGGLGDLGCRAKLAAPEQHGNRAVLRSGLRLPEAVSRVRRHAGQLFVVRAERQPADHRYRQRGLDYGAGRRRLPRPHRSDRPEYHLRGIAGRQSLAARFEDQRIEVDPPQEDNDTAPRYRFQWNSPLIISPHDAKTIYYGGNHLFKSTDRGDTWVRLGEDLTNKLVRDEQGDSGQGPEARRDALAA
jgi:photosystem II stability/assembly factor-like uncharacterized protein